MSGGIDRIAEALGYAHDHGYLAADDFAQQPNHRHALRLASQLMQVRSAFGLWTGREGALLGPKHARFMPLVFMAEVRDAAQAEQVHRSVWSQGLAPYLLACAEDRLWVCQGFAFSSKDWKRFATEIALPSGWRHAELAAHDALAPLTARKLRSSLAWRDEARTADEFVDERLLRSLASLSVAFSEDTPTRGSLEPAVINALIARLLYFYFLIDRGFITRERLDAWELPGIGLGRDDDWRLEDVQTLFKRLDEVFNGSIFPMPEAFARAYDAQHLNLLRRVLRPSAELGKSDAIQLSFLDYDFASIRTETLSAIYEMFLRNEDKNAGRNFGAFYTPPYLADYTLDRLEDQAPLGDGTRVLDPAAGSGVFLVGAYRRIVEASLATGSVQLPLGQLHTLMTENIFGVELNPTACHVAAFSLYLTMLDYVDPTEAADYTRWPTLVGRPRLFPPMLIATDSRAANIRAGDFFSEIAVDLRCDMVVGNPPWVQLKTLNSDHAHAYLKRTRVAIGDKQAAELFLWKAYRDHLSDGGVIGLLLPQKSLVNAHSGKFTRVLRETSELIGIADLAHLRYVLFRRSAARTAGGSESASERGARQSTAIVVLRKAPPNPGQRFWLYRPLRSTQPASRSGRLWTLVHDWTQVVWQDVDDVGEANWRRLFTCAAIDRRVLTKLDRQVATGRLISLRQLDQRIGLQFKIEVDQNIDREFVLSNDRRKPTYWRRQLGLEGGLFPDAPTAVPLPPEQIAKAHPKSRPFLMGNVVLLPRSCETALFVEPPIATSFFIVACFPDLTGSPIPARHRHFLQVLAIYLASRTFRYLCFVNSRRMTIDRANIELNEALDLPWPFGDFETDDWEKLATTEPSEREAMLCSALGLPSLYQRLVAEFSEFREAFTDGGTPPEAMRESGGEQIGSYLEAVLHEIDGGKGRYVAGVVPAGPDLLATVVQYRNMPVPQPDLDALATEAMQAYLADGASALSQSRYLWHSRARMASVLIKPTERMHWTLDRAFADADLVTAAAMAGYDRPSAR